MKPASKNLTPSGISQKKNNNFRSLRLYLIFGSIAIFSAFAIYTQFLIQNAKKEQEHLPRIFAKYITYMEGYLRQSEKYANFIGEIWSTRFEILTSTETQDINTALGEYLFSDFPRHNPIPVIITDADSIPQIWNQVGVSADTSFADLSVQSRQALLSQLPSMNRSSIVVDSLTTNYVFISRPVSFSEFIRGVDYSVVVTDKIKIPIFWHMMGIPENLSWNELTANHKAILRQRMGDMSEVPLTDRTDGYGYIYFTGPKSLIQIRNMVYLELAFGLLLIIFGAYGLYLLHQTERDTLWVGLAKETAHQFGTPITSLMGWLDLLRESPPESGTRPDLGKIIDYMTTDLNQLKIIASRFGKVGSQTKLQQRVLHDLLEDTVHYFKDRLPHLGSRIDLHLISKIQGIKVMLDVDLIKWTMENLIKNCIDAMSQKGGNIVITATHGSKHVYVHIHDEGKGIPHSQWKKIFDPGVTTKTRGWGLGLSLAKRIIEEYHHGRIRVLESTLGEGTTFEIKLPFEPGKQE